MKDLKHLIYFESLLDNADNELVEQAKKDGKLIMGYTCYHIPEVLLNVDNCVYYHFDNIYELMIWGLEAQLHEVSKDYINYENWKTGYLHIYYFALERKTYIKKIFQTLEQENLEHYVNKIAERMVIAVIDDKLGDKSLDEDERLFTARVCSHVLTATLMNWVSQGMKEDPEIMVKRTGRLLDGMIEKTINE